MHSTEKNCLNGSPVSNRETCDSGIQQFSFEGTHNVQVVIINCEPWFIAVEICNLLGLSNPTKALYGLEHDEYLALPIVRAGQRRLVNLVNESGLYALIFQSRKPIAKKFRKWVTSEVFPAIRKTGMYVPETKSEELTGQYVKVKGMNNNLYISSVMKAFKEFLEEEQKGCVFTERRLNDKINAARVLFPEGKIAFRNQNIKNRMK